MQDTDIPVKTLKENYEYFAEKMCHQFNEATCASKLIIFFRNFNVVLEKAIVRNTVVF